MSGPEEAVRLLRLGFPEAAAGHLPAEWAPLGAELVHLQRDLERTLARAQAAEAQVTKVREVLARIDASRMEMCRACRSPGLKVGHDCGETRQQVSADLHAALGSVGATEGAAQ